MPSRWRKLPPRQSRPRVKAIPRRQISHTPRSRKLLESYGCLVDKTEYWNSFANKKRDLFNIFDLVALDPRQSKIIGIQVTTRDHIAHRRAKILDSHEAEAWVCCHGAIQIHGWDKKGEARKWDCKIVIISKDDFNASKNAIKLDSSG